MDRNEHEESDETLAPETGSERSDENRADSARRTKRADAVEDDDDDDDAVEDDDDDDAVEDDDDAIAADGEADDDADGDDDDDADGDDDDDDADGDDDDDDDDDDDADDDVPAPTSPGRRSPGPTLLMLAGGAWAIAAVLRCVGPEPGPSLSVSPDAASDPAPADDAPAADDERPADDRETPEADPAADESTPSDDAADGEADDGEDPVPLEALPEDWATNLTLPEKVEYTILRGGSLKNVANLFVIFHHEISALNPGIAIDRELPPNSKVVLYRYDETAEPSESVGLPSNGSLQGAVPMLEGPGRLIKAKPEKRWATRYVVALLDQVLRQWARRGKDVQPILVGNMAARKGGKLPPHSTHQSGRDVDLGYLQKLPEGEELNWRTITAENLDAEETWALLQLLHSTGQVEVIFIDTAIQKLLYDHAVKHGTVPKGQLSRWLEYPRSPPQRRALVQHVPGHVDHLHVRFQCQPDESRCRSRER